MLRRFAAQHDNAKWFFPVFSMAKEFVSAIIPQSKRVEEQPLQPSTLNF
jgi:hypothetical protein